MVEEAATCRAVLTQADRLWPKRLKASDGILPSNAHSNANPTSDHELGNAVDLTHDPDNGCDAHAWAQWLSRQRFPEVKYIISRGKIWSTVRSNEGWRDRPGDGSDDHVKHAHVSINSNYRNSFRNWFPVTSQDEDEDMTPAQAKQLAEVHAWLKQLTAPRNAAKTDVDPSKLSLADLYTLIEKHSLNT